MSKLGYGELINAAADKVLTFILVSVSVSYFMVELVIRELVPYWPGAALVPYSIRILVAAAMGLRVVAYVMRAYMDMVLASEPTKVRKDEDRVIYVNWNTDSEGDG